MFIAKHCKTLKQAERYQNQLYDKYWCVKLVRFPSFEESGLYTWEVQKNGPTKA